MSIIEIIAAVFGAVGVWLAVKQHIWNWWISLVSVIIYVYIFAKALLYADAGVEIVYILLTFYGLNNWKNGGDNATLKVSNTPKLYLVVYAFIISILTVLIAQVLTLLGSSMLWLDALTASMSLVATYMMARKQLEHWLLWIVADSIYIYMYVQKDLLPT
ncbi:MAG: nicotinamide mononucleotide transporter, partial [Bacteroidia bacterium]|nr:nicotinamide mononucleotide transporter [Bacteroidia bacterium]